MAELEDRWVILEASADEGFPFLILDRGTDRKAVIRFGCMDEDDTRLLIEALAFSEALEHGYMPAATLPQAQTKKAPEKQKAKRPPAQK